MHLLVVGSLAYDSVKTPFGERNDVLGGSASFLSTAASFFCPVRTVGVVGDDFDPAHLEFFVKRGIDIGGIVKAEGATFRWRGRYEDNLNVAHTLDTQLNVFETFDPTIPDHFKTSEYVVLGNIDPSLQARVLEQVSAPSLVACDTMNFWIEGARDALGKTLRGVGLLSINDAEARMLSGEHNLVKAARAILKMGPTRLVIKRGEHGVMLFAGDDIFVAPAYPLETVRDPTGAGDSFAGGMLGYLAHVGKDDPQTLRQAVVMGSTMASFAVEDFSLERLAGLTPGELKKRFERFQELTHFSVDGDMSWAD